MRDNWVPNNTIELSAYLRALSNSRGSLKKQTRLQRRQRKRLSSAERDTILEKTDGRCHLCGGPIDGAWEADHVLAHIRGGGDSVDNYLPAHRICNNYRWFYLAEEFQEILRLGVWLRTQIEKQTRLGESAGEEFVKYEKQRIARRNRQKKIGEEE
jgi:5-methylcytosine-specific restriction endonuclease McrA